MNRQLMITAIVFLVAGAITLGVLQFVIRLHGGVTKAIIGIVVAVIAGAIAYFVTRGTPSAQA